MKNLKDIIFEKLRISNSNKKVTYPFIKCTFKDFILWDCLDISEIDYDFMKTQNLFKDTVEKYFRNYDEFLDFVKLHEDDLLIIEEHHVGRSKYIYKFEIDDIQFNEVTYIYRDSDLLSKSKYIIKESLVNEKLKITGNKKSNNEYSIVILVEFLKWLFDVTDEYELSIDLVNNSCDQLYGIEEYYGCYTQEAYNFLMSYKDEEVEIETKKSKYDGTYEFLFVLPYNDSILKSPNKKNILLRFYNDTEIPEDIKL